MNRRFTIALFALAIAGLAHAADLAPGAPALSQETADLRRDAVEIVFDVQLTARQLREHQRHYAWYWKYGAAEWQKAEVAALPAFKGAFDKDDAFRKQLRDKHADTWMKDAQVKADLGSPYHKWLLATVSNARKEIAVGPPALRRDVLDNTLEFIQWGLKMQLTVGQQEEFLRMIPQEWDKATPKETRKVIVEEFMPVYRQVKRFTPDQRTQLFKLVEPELKKAMKDTETPMDKWMAQVNATANKVMAEGPPEPLTAGGTLQHADYYDWSLGIRLDDNTRAELQRLIVLDWTTMESTRKGSLSTARLMDDPPKGGMGELSRVRDTVNMLSFIVGQPDNKVNRAAHAAYIKAHPTDKPMPLAPAGKVLALGERPLTEGISESGRLYFEWLLGFEFTDAERSKFRELIVDEWKRADKDAMTGTLEIAFNYSQIAVLSPADRALLQAFDHPKALEVMRQTGDKDKTNQWLIDLYDAKKPSLSKEKNGPRQEDVDSLGELLHFRVMEVTGGDKAAADKVKAATVEKVKAGTIAQSEVLGARRQLAVLQYTWPKLNDVDRQELRDQWADALRYVGVQAKLAKWQSTPAPAKEMDYLAAMKALQQQQQNTAMISNMLKMQHQTNMTIIRNMGSTPYKYEYKYEYRRR